MMNKINTYCYYVLPGKSIPLHVVEIKHIRCCAFSVFSSSKDAKNYIESEKESLNKYAELIYDPDFIPAKGLCKVYGAAETLFSKVSNHQIYINCK